jgi:CheY-like chemotaxis protein
VTYPARIRPIRSPLAKWDPLVLVVARQEDLRRMMLEVLTFHGARAEGATSVGEALAIAETAPPDLIVADLSGTRDGGHEAFHHLSTDRRAAGTRAVYTAGRIDPRLWRRLRVRGDAFLAMPFQVEDLVRTAATVLTRRART